MRRALVVVLGTVIGCSLPLWLLPEPHADYAVESTTDAVPFRDARRPSDTGAVDSRRDVLGADTWTPPSPCDYPLPDAFSCPTIADKVPETVCTDLMLLELKSCFVGPETRCSTARKAYPACAKCMLETWIADYRVDIGACMHVIDPSSPCGRAARCEQTCAFEVCGDCDFTIGSGSIAKASEFGECVADATAPPGDASGGACWSVAGKTVAGCRADPRFAPCFVETADDIVPFFRGACGTGGVWSDGDGGADAAESEAVGDSADAAD
ncbi:MAG: hypothetical protein HYV09_15545 [Deltaproteobacteria bacterium]|nr:hypothetical protein [Deltaproteobacteria bacterium]